jgi:Second Messenger Oligonucleotide or Dinucleotide Synthetase domain
MSLTTRQAFDQFLEDISITEYQRTVTVPARQSAVVEHLTDSFLSTSDMPFVESCLMGSASKGTIVRPIDDVDVLAKFSNVNRVWEDKYANDSQAFLYRIRNAYAGAVTSQVGARGQAIRVFFKAGGHVDVAPVFIQTGDGQSFYLPDGSGGWILTSPFVANTWFSNRNTNFNYNLAPMVRLVKKWNGAHSKRLKSFNLETMAASMFTAMGTNHRKNLLVFFQSASNWMDVNDPGGHTGLLSGYLSLLTRDDVRRSFDTAADRAGRAISSEEGGNHDEAKRLWSIVLGPGFPVN